MTFKIEFEDNKELLDRDIEDGTYGEAIETIYLDNEIIIFWNGIQIPVSLKFDISVCWRDIIVMIENLKNDIQSFEMMWSSQSFWVNWRFCSINESEYVIRSTWNTEWREVADKELVVNKKNFIGEWEIVIDQIRDDLLKQGYNLSSLRYDM